MNQLPCRLAVLTGLAITVATTAHAASISYAGADLTTSGAWRTPSAANEVMPASRTEEYFPALP
jgi:hypothetical protein